MHQHTDLDMSTNGKNDFQQRMCVASGRSDRLLTLNLTRKRGNESSEDEVTFSGVSQSLRRNYKGKKMNRG